MKAYSEDLRHKIIEALNRSANKSQAARLFGVSLSSVKRYARMAREGRPLAPRKAPGKRSKIDESGRRLLETDLKERPAATFSERCKFLERVNKFYDQSAWFTGRNNLPASSLRYSRGGFFDFTKAALRSREFTRVELSWRISDHYPL